MVEVELLNEVNNKVEFESVDMICYKKKKKFVACTQLFWG